MLITCTRHCTVSGGVVGYSSTWRALSHAYRVLVHLPCGSTGSFRDEDSTQASLHTGQENVPVIFWQSTSSTLRTRTVVPTTERGGGLEGSGLACVLVVAWIACLPRAPLPYRLLAALFPHLCPSSLLSSGVRKTGVGYRSRWPG